MPLEFQGSIAGRLSQLTTLEEEDQWNRLAKHLLNLPWPWPDLHPGLDDSWQTLSLPSTLSLDSPQHHLDTWLYVFARNDTGENVSRLRLSPTHARRNRNNWIYSMTRVKSFTTLSAPGRLLKSAQLCSSRNSLSAGPGKPYRAPRVTLMSSQGCDFFDLLTDPPASPFFFFL